MNSKHDIKDLDLLYSDARILVNELVLEKIDGLYLKEIDKNLSNLEDYWHGQDAIIQINKLIDTKNLLIDNRDILGNIGVYISMLVKKYRDAQNANSVILPTFSQLSFPKMMKSEQINTNSTNIYMNNNISIVVDDLNKFISNLKEMDDRVLRVKNSILNNWVQEDENRNYAVKMFDKFSTNSLNITKDINEIIKCINNSIENYNFSLAGVDTMPSLESMFNNNINKEEKVLDSIKKNLNTNKQVSDSFNRILANEVKKDLRSKGIVE